MANSSANVKSARESQRYDGPSLISAVVVKGGGILHESFTFSRILGGGFKTFFMFTLLEEIIQSDDHIFQMGGSTTT